jgi:hypothetical protein
MGKESEMAKQKTTTKGNSKNGGGNGKGSTRYVAENVESSKEARAVIIAARRHQERVRESELEAGTFYTRLNAGRSTDIAVAVAGNPGNYAFPGGNQPSVHFNVGKEIGPKGAMFVIRFEVAQRGHELEGRPFDTKTYLKCDAVTKFGTQFRSHLEDPLAAATQELICHHLAKQLEGSQPSQTQEPMLVVETIEEKFEKSNKNLAGILDGVPGIYGLKTSEGIVIFDVFPSKKVSVAVLASTIPGITPSRAFLPIYLLGWENLPQVTDDATYKKQVEIYKTLRPELIEEISRRAEGAKVAAEQATKIAETEAQARSKKIAEANDRATQATALAAMRGRAIPIAQAAFGKLGYVDLSGDGAELIVQFASEGADKAVRVEYISASHPLRLVGVEKGEKLFAGQVLRGNLDRFESERLTSKAVKTKEALISFIRRKMDAAGVHLKAKPALRLVKAA